MKIKENQRKGLELYNTHVATIPQTINIYIHNKVNNLHFDPHKIVRK